VKTNNRLNILATSRDNISYHLPFEYAKMDIDKGIAYYAYTHDTSMRKIMNEAINDEEVLNSISLIDIYDVGSDRYHPSLAYTENKMFLAKDDYITLYGMKTAATRLEALAIKRKLFCSKDGHLVRTE
jgi:hypothetical protein